MLSESVKILLEGDQCRGWDRTGRYTQASKVLSCTAHAAQCTQCVCKQSSFRIQTRPASSRLARSEICIYSWRSCALDSTCCWMSIMSLHVRIPQPTPRWKLVKRNFFAVDSVNSLGNELVNGYRCKTNVDFIKGMWYDFLWYINCVIVFLESQI